MGKGERTMDNNELDKVLKEKLKNQITPSKEFEQKMRYTIKEQKEKAKKETKKTSKKFRKNEIFNIYGSSSFNRIYDRNFSE